MTTPIFGNTTGLSSSEAAQLKSIGLAKVPQHQLVTRDLAHRMTALSYTLHRKIGALVNRNGHVECVILGTADRCYLPDIGRARAGLGRLRGIRLLVTTLSPDKTGGLISMDEMTDLTKLRLDWVVSVMPSILGAPEKFEYAHIIPTQKGIGVDRTFADSADALPQNADEMLKAFEGELRQTTQQAHAADLPPAILVHIDAGEKDARERREEMLELCRTAGIEVVRIIEQRRRQIDPRTLVGSGKLQEIELHALDEDAQFIIFDRELTPAQSRALTRVLPFKLLDRTQLILDIFAQRAKSVDGKLQVELAQLKYNLPKLIDQDTAMSRLTGGVGGRGPGETKLEINRRKARERMQALERALKDRENHRQLQRKKRNEQQIPIFSLVGYTNAGKSTLLNALTKSDVFAENLLFATLDTTSRKLRFPRLQEVIFTDTVGFIRDLPKDLVAAFKATLEELQDADVLLHVIDASNPQIHSQIEAVEKILKDLNLGEKKMLRILNKCDLIPPQDAIELCSRYDAVAISAKFQTSTLPLIDRIQAIYMGEDAKPEAEIRVLHFDQDN